MGVLAASTLALWFAATLGFSDSVSCDVEGYVDAEPGNAPVFTRVDSCQGISQRLEESNLLLWSPHRWAVIVLPPNGAHVRLTYDWGSPTAQLDQDTLPVMWGPLAQG